MNLERRVAKLETTHNPPRRPATLADIVLAVRGDVDFERLDLAGWEPLIEWAREAPAAQKGVAPCQA
jgi:hypothetical protein